MSTCNDFGTNQGAGHDQGVVGLPAGRRHDPHASATQQLDNVVRQLRTRALLRYQKYAATQLLNWAGYWLHGDRVSAGESSIAGPAPRPGDGLKKSQQR